MKQLKEQLIYYYIKQTWWYNNALEDFTPRYSFGKIKIYKARYPIQPVIP